MDNQLSLKKLSTFTGTYGLFWLENFKGFQPDLHRRKHKVLGGTCCSFWDLAVTPHRKSLSEWMSLAATFFFLGQFFLRFFGRDWMKMVTGNLDPNITFNWCGHSNRTPLRYCSLSWSCIQRYQISVSCSSWEYFSSKWSWVYHCGWCACKFFW